MSQEYCTQDATNAFACLSAATSVLPLADVLNILGNSQRPTEVEGRKEKSLRLPSAVVFMCAMFSFVGPVLQKQL